MRMYLVAALVLLAACKASNVNAGTGRTERERDSIIGRSKVPGAGAVQKALDTSDSAQHRQAALDSAATQP